MGDRIERKEALCPFYASESKKFGIIYCEGIGTASSIALNFESRPKRNEYCNRFCYSRQYEICPMFKTINEKYEGEI